MYDTLFELLNLPIDCNFIWVPVYIEDRDWCRVWIWQTPPNTCALMQACIDSAFLSTIIPSWWTGLTWNTTVDGIEIELDPLFMDANIASRWTTPNLTVGTTTNNLASLLMASSVYRSISDQLQTAEWRPVYTVWNKRILPIGWIDGMSFYRDADPLSPTFEQLVVGFPHEFITSLLWAPSQYDYNYRSSAGLDPYNPRRYVLTRYTDTVSQNDSGSYTWEWRNCGRAVWSEPDCCMQTLVLDWCMLGLGGWDSCNGRCQTVRNRINWSERASICNIFDQQLSFADNEICYQLPWATQADPYIDVCVDISETNNHYLKTYPGSESMKYILELYNVNHVLQTQLNLAFMNDQQLVYNTIAVTPQPAHPVAATINNTVCITQPWILPDQCVDLNKVNDQEFYRDGHNLVINSVLDPQNDCDLACDGRKLDLHDWLAQWNCNVPCDCLMNSVPDWSLLIAEPPTWRPAWRAAFIASNPSVYDMMNRIVDHIAWVQTELWPNSFTSAWYTAPCAFDIEPIIDPIPPVPPHCDPCCTPCGWNWGTTINIFEWDTNIRNIWVTLNDKKHHGKRWLTTDRTVTQAFNGSLDPDGDVCNPLTFNVWRTEAGNAFAGAYGRDPSGMPASQMTTPFDAISGIKCLVDGSYDIYMDWPIWVNHMVHAYRISMILHRWANDIILLDYKMSWDPVSWSGSVNNGYYKESKQLYVHANKHIELLRNDVVTLQVKIDANCSWPWDNLDPITLWEPMDDTTLRSSESGTWCSDTQDDLIFRCTDGTGWSTLIDPSWNVENAWVWIEYGWPSTLAFAQNFNWLQYGWHPVSNDRIYAWLNGFVRTAVYNESISLSHSCSEWSCSDHSFNINHSHAVVARMPAIAPQAPKYIHFTSTIDADWNYPGRYTPANLNPDSWHAIPYSNTGIDANGQIVLLAMSGLNESACPADSHYSHIAEQSWFSFWFNMIRWLRPDQIEIY